MRVLVGLVAAVAATCAVLALGGRVDARLDVLSHLAPFYLLIGLVIAAGAAAWPRRLGRPALVLGLVSVVAATLLIAPEIVRDSGPRAAPDAPGQVKVVQMKMAHGSGWVRPLAWIEAERPDFVMVTGAPRGLRDHLLARGWHVAGGGGSMMIFTATQYLRMTRPRPHPRLWFVNATYGGRDGRELEALSAHLGWPTDPGLAGQLHALDEVLASRPRENMIFAGDLNATPWSARLAGLDRTPGLIRRDKALPTWPAQVLGHRWPLPFMPLDHVYAGQEWATVSVRRGPWLRLEHYPVIVTLAPIASRAPVRGRDR